MSNKKILAGILGLFSATLVLLAFLLFFTNDESKIPEHTNQALSSKKKIPSSPSNVQEPLPPPAPSSQANPAVNQIAQADPISDVLSNTSLDFTGVVTKLLETLPRLDPERQAEAAHHISNLSDDTTCSTWSRLVASNSLPTPTAEVLFNDMLNRPHELLMPFLGAIADQPTHPLHKDSTDVLETLFGQPPQGTPWSAWVKNSSSQEGNKK